MSTIENVIADTVLILFTDLGNVVPHAVDIVEEFIAAIVLVFFAAQFTQSWRLEERYHVYPRLQNNLHESQKVNGCLVL